MKKPTSTLLKLSGIVLSTCIILFSCSQSDKGNRGQREENITSEQADATQKSTNTQPQPKFKGDSTRTFIRKANLSFKVKDVRTATFDIERIVNANRGYVTSSELESNINYKSSVRISKDSMLDMTNYTVHSNIMMRIPNTELDKTLTEIASLIDYLDYRRVNAEDITAQLQDARLTEKRYTQHTQRLEKAIDEKGNKLNQLVDAEDNLLEKQQYADQSKINSGELAHDVKYSTIAIKIYQKETTRKEAYAYSAPIEPYQPNFGVKLLDAVSVGAVVFGEILLFFIKLWPIALLVVAFIFIFKSVRKLKWFN